MFWKCKLKSDKNNRHLTYRYTNERQWLVTGVTTVAFVLTVASVYMVAMVTMITFFYVLLTVHLSVFILVINQLDAQNLFYNKFISCLYMFRAPCANRQEVKIVLYSLWYHHTYRCPSRAQDGHLWLWWYQRLYNTILTWRFAHGARNM